MKTTTQKATLTGSLVALATLASAAHLQVPADYATIQAAVNAAVSGDTVHIAPGVYAEQTWITNKTLTLIGRPGTILRAFPGMAPALPGIDNQRCILRIVEGSDVTLRNLSFEGDQLADQNQPSLLGVNFDLSGGRVEHCRFTGFREKTPGSAKGLAIKFWNGYSGTSRYEATVSSTTIVDSYSGIAIQGTLDEISYDVTVVDNTIAGVSANNIARWDGSSWEPLGPGLGAPNSSDYISALAAHGNHLYAAAVFRTAGLVDFPPSQVYRWDGASWTAVGSATDRAIYALAALGDELYVGGEFSVAGGKASGNLARVFLNGAPPFEKIGSRASAFFRGLPTGGFSIDRTTDLITWENLAIRYAGESGGIDFIDPSAPEPRAFYRAVPVEP